MTPEIVQNANDTNDLATWLQPYNWTDGSRCILQHYKNGLDDFWHTIIPWGRWTTKNKFLFGDTTSAMSLREIILWDNTQFALKKRFSTNLVYFVSAFSGPKSLKFLPFCTTLLAPLWWHHGSVILASRLPWPDLFRVYISESQKSEISTF